MKKDDFSPNEIRTVVITCIVEGGTDIAIVQKCTGTEIRKIQDMIEEINSWHS